MNIKHKTFAFGKYFYSKSCFLNKFMLDSANFLNIFVMPVSLSVNLFVHLSVPGSLFVKCTAQMDSLPLFLVRGLDLVFGQKAGSGNKGKF